MGEEPTDESKGLCVPSLVQGPEAIVTRPGAFGPRRPVADKKDLHLIRLRIGRADRRVSLQGSRTGHIEL